ncbi:MAG: response regulator [Methanolinea sp.]|nr:response regulator [Methanolinea sp.]
MIRILFVDDDPDIRELMTDELMEHGGIQVESSTSAVEAIQVLLKNRYDAVVSDNRMTGMDGIDFFRTIRPLYPDMVFILYSGGECDDRIRSALKDGLDRYVRRSGDLEGEVSDLISIIGGKIRDKARTSFSSTSE